MKKPLRHGGDVKASEPFIKKFNVSIAQRQPKNQEDVRQMPDTFVNGFYGKKEVHGTFGDLMDTANRTGDSASKDFLRKCFQGWCKKTGKNMWDAATVMEWRSLPFTTHVPE